MKYRKTMAAFFAICSACALFQPAMADKLGEYQQSLEQQQQIQEAIDGNQSNITDMESEKTALQQEYEALQARVDVLQQQVGDYDLKIMSMEDKLDVAQQEADDKYIAYCSRIRGIEEQGVSSYWSILFRASSLSDLMGRMDYVAELMKSDETTLNALNRNYQVLQEESDELTSARADRNYAETELKTAQYQLNDKIKQRISEIEDLESKNSSLQAEMDDLSEESAQLLAELTAASTPATGYIGNDDANEIYQQYVVNTGLAAQYPEGSKIVAYTLQFVGGEYVWGGASPDVGFDCSGLMYYVYAQFGYSICRTAGIQYAYSGTPVNSIEDLQPGDMVFFHHPDETTVAHVGMYIGDGFFVHAASRASGIKISSITSEYYASNYIGAKRVIS